MEPERPAAGRMLLRCAQDEVKVTRTMQDLFRSKSTSTLRTRVGSISLFFARMIATEPDWPVLPILEERLYEYACYCSDVGKSPSRLDTLLASLIYVGQAFGFEGAVEPAESTRVKGSSHAMFLNRQPRVRAAALHTTMVCWIEICCFAMPDAFDRVVAGLCMICIMGRLRCSDANRIRHAGLVGRYVEGALSRTKTSRSKEKATAFIPLVVPAFGLLGKPWFLEFVKARRAIGLRDIPGVQSQSHDLTFLLVPAHAGIAYEVQSPMDSGELTDRLRAMLSKGFSDEQLCGVSSHSLKATLLAYMNLWGCSLPTSELLGYHVNPEHQSALNYTRDCLSGPIREMVDMMSQVNEGTFVPQAARDAIFPPPLSRKRITRQFLETTGLTVVDAARVLQGDGRYSNQREQANSDERIRVLSSPCEISTVGMMVYLTADSARNT